MFGREYLSRKWSATPNLHIGPYLNLILKSKWISAWKLWRIDAPYSRYQFILATRTGGITAWQETTLFFQYIAHPFSPTR